MDSINAVLSDTEEVAMSSTKRWHPNEFGKFDCPEEGCPFKGENGFRDALRLGSHRRYAHRVAGESRNAIKRRERDAKAKQSDEVTPAPVFKAGRGTLTRVKPSEPPVTPTTTSLQQSVVQARMKAVASIMNMPEVMTLGKEDLLSVFDAVISVKQ